MAEPAQSPAGAIQGQDPNVVYALGSSPGESARLQRQADELAADSAYLLDRAGLRPGQAASSAWTRTRRTPRWRPSSPPGGD